MIYFEALSRILSGGTEEHHENFSQDILLLRRLSHLGPPEH
jgi:hypothetical protein